MATITNPVIENWYKDLENNLCFKIMVIDSDSIEVQYINGEIGSYDQESWYSSTFDYIEAPEDWSVAYDHLEWNDLDYSDLNTHFNLESGDINIANILDRTS